MTIQIEENLHLEYMHQKELCYDNPLQIIIWFMLQIEEKLRTSVTLARALLLSLKPTPTISQLIPNTFVKLQH